MLVGGIAYMGDATHLILDKPGGPRYTLDALVRERLESLDYLW